MSALGEWDEPDDYPDLEVNAAASGEAAERKLMYANLGEFVQDYLAIAYARDIDSRQRYWCPEWWRHTEALARLDAIWRAWEHLRHDPATGMSTWWRDHADHHMPALLGEDGPFRRCAPDRGHGARHTGRLPSSQPPAEFWATSHG